jgi:hypothetical protein
MSFAFPGSKTLSAQQITQEWEAAGAPANVAQVFGGPLTTAEGGGNTGVVYNTAYPSLPGYTPVLAGDQPEYSVGLYGENIYGDLGQPSPSQAYAIGQKLAANPQYQTDVAAQMFSQRGFQPWEGDAYVKSQGGPGAALADLGYSSPPQIKGGTAFTANIPKTTPSASTSGNPAKKATTTSSWNPLKNLSPFTPAPTVGPSWLPWNWPSDAANSAWSSALSVIIIILGLVLVVWGLKITFERSSSGGGGGGGEPVIVNAERDIPEAAAA